MAKLKWGMVGGGEGSQIGPAHRISAGLDGYFEFVAGALDYRPAAGREFGQRLGLSQDRSYGDWREMLEGERRRPAAREGHAFSENTAVGDGFEIDRGSSWQLCHSKV